MYYDNKLGFYIKQYGTQIVVGIICLIINIISIILKKQNKTGLS